MLYISMPLHTLGLVRSLSRVQRDLNSVYADLRSVLSQRPILRYLRAKRHSADIQAMATKLQLTSDSFTVGPHGPHHSNRITQVLHVASPDSEHRDQLFTDTSACCNHAGRYCPTLDLASRMYKPPPQCHPGRSYITSRLCDQHCMYVPMVLSCWRLGGCMTCVAAILHSFNCKRLPSALEVAQVDPINYLHLAPSNKSHSKEPLRRIDSAD